MLSRYDAWKTTPPEDEPEFDDGPDPDDLRDEMLDRLEHDDQEF
jgi:hypothetical protein